MSALPAGREDSPPEPQRRHPYEWHILQAEGMQENNRKFRAPSIASTQRRFAACQRWGHALAGWVCIQGDFKVVPARVKPIVGQQNQEMMTKEKTERLSFVREHPIVSFFVLALVLGAGTIYLVIQGVIPTNLALSSVLSASIAGIIVTAILDGKAGLKLMLSRVLIWRVGIGYWLFSMLFLVPAIFLGSLLNPLFNGDPISLSNMKPAFNILPMFIVFFIVAGLGQELGWTGFLMPRLQARFAAFTSCVIRAILTGVWHLPLLIYSGLQPYALPDFPYGVWIVQRGFLIAFLVMIVLFSLPWSIFYTWIFNNTEGSLLLVATLHGSEIWLVYFMMSMGISSNNLNNYWGYGMVMVLTAIMIVIVTGSQDLSRKHKRVVYQRIHDQETLRE